MMLAYIDYIPYLLVPLHAVLQILWDPEEEERKHDILAAEVSNLKVVMVTFWFGTTAMLFSIVFCH